VSQQTVPNCANGFECYTSIQYFKLVCHIMCSYKEHTARAILPVIVSRQF